MSIQRAAEIISNADALFIGAGAGMGVDSGLPDFRGDEGFWRSYPPFRNLDLNFYDLANPRWFRDDPALAWGFYGHRLQLYRDTEPHDGFEILLEWGRAMDGGSFVFTSNVDGQFQHAGFSDDRIMECHGSIHHMQCHRPCRDEIWSGAPVEVEIDEDTFRATSELPECGACGTIARPNILMFGDARWLARRTNRQQSSMGDWLDRNAGRRTVIIECGAGTAVPTVRHRCERLASRDDVDLIRINPREAHGPESALSIAMGALEALREIDELLH
ncbi:MAG: SIR2 family NAD-dependent protein deacylase [Myxococcota bacterium]